MNEKELEFILEQLKEIIQDIKKFEGFIEDKMLHLTEDVTIIRKEMSGLQKDISSIREDITEIKKLQKYILQMLEDQKKLLTHSEDDSSVKWLH